MATEAEQRAAVVAEARSWLGTKWHHYARAKGVGVDCAMLIAEVFERAGVVGRVDVPLYTAQWHLHRDESKFADFVAALAPEVAAPPEREPRPGDIVIFRFHRAFAHGGVVSAWPRIIHAFTGAGVCEDDVIATQWLATVSERTELQGQPRARRFFSYWAPRAAV